ncbi:MAG: glycosyltransferase family 4 protein [Clostridia bacterium]|nr:glycosyltransferase family 4 protein [Clostridia bacterium]
MRVLIPDAYFNPEITAFTHLENDIINSLIERGHELKVICPIPQRGIDKETQEKYRHIKHETLMDGKIEIERFWVPKEKSNILSRAFRYFWCNFRGYQIGKKYKGIDMLFSESTPPTQGLLMSMLKKKLKCSIVYSLQDVFPDSLVNAKMTKEGSLIWRAGRILEKYTYKKVDVIVTISKGIRKNLLRKGVPAEKIEMISNWVNIDNVYPVEREKNTIIDEFGVDKDKFLVVYAGNFGAAQGADIVLKAAKELEENREIQFVIFGGGSYFEDAKNEAQSLSNVIINPLLPQSRVSEVYSLGDVSLITCKEGTGGASFPSKTWSIMACNTPIIASFDTESDLAEMLRASNAGECVAAGDAKLLADAIERKYTKWKNGEGEDINLREYVEKNATKEICAGAYVTVMENLCNGKCK